jgi:membrane protein YdbS with pleckstrin-like domain
MSEPAAEEGADGSTGGGGDGGLERPDGPPEWLSLDEGEQLQWVGQPSSTTLVPAAFWGLLLLVVAGLGLVVFAASYLNVKNTDYVVTNTTLYHKRGILSTNIESVGLDRIQNTEFSQSFAGKQLGYGTIEISTAGSSGSDLAFRSVDRPRDVRDLVNRLGPSAGGAGGGQETPAGGSGADEQLLRELLAELRAVNESMSNVERMLRGDEGAGRSRGGSGSSSTSRSTATSPGSPTGDTDPGRGAPGSSATGGTSGAGGTGATSDGAGGGGAGGGGAGGGGAGGGGAGGGGAGGGGAGGGGAGSGGAGPDGSEEPADGQDDGAGQEEDTAREFVTDESDDDEEPPAPPFGGEGG